MTHDTKSRLIEIARNLCVIAFVLLCHCDAEQPAPCLVVAHASTVGKRLVWTALIGVPIAPGANYDYVDSTLTKVKMKYRGKELQKLREQGVRILVEQKGQHVTCNAPGGTK